MQGLMQCILVFAVVSIVMIAMPTTMVLAGDQVVRERVEEKIVYAYKIVYELGRMGIDVSSLVDKLNEARKLIDKGDYGGAEKIVDEVISEAEALKKEAPGIVFWRNFRKAVTVVCLASIPILTYFFLPRVYLEAWYRLKRKWVVRK